jgi:rhodanese-related sulfurtransferase
MSQILESPLQAILLVAFVAFMLRGVLTGMLVRRRLPGVIAEGALLVDVRSAGEFGAGHAANSLNIPLDQLTRRAGELDRSRWVVVCCASGMRSAQAQRWLRRNGFPKVLNAGTWRNLPR